MAWTVKPNTGSLWKNEDRKSENHPTGKGSALIDGVEYWIAAWTKKTKQGETYHSLSFTKKEANVKSQMKREDSQRGHPKVEDEESDVPF